MVEVSAEAGQRKLLLRLFQTGLERVEAGRCLSGYLPDASARGKTVVLGAGVEASDRLSRNQTYHLFFAVGDLITAGPTLTNVKDFCAILMEP